MEDPDQLLYTTFIYIPFIYIFTLLFYVRYTFFHIDYTFDNFYLLFSGFVTDQRVSVFREDVNIRTLLEDIKYSDIYELRQNSDGYASAKKAKWRAHINLHRNIASLLCRRTHYVEIMFTLHPLGAVIKTMYPSYPLDQDSATRAHSCPCASGHLSLH